MPNPTSVARFDAEHTVDLLRAVVDAHGDLDAFVESDGSRISFGEWQRRADGLSAALADLGVGPGDVVCLMLPSCIDYMVCYQAVMRLGAICSGINLRLGPGGGAPRAGLRRTQGRDGRRRPGDTRRPPLRGVANCPPNWSNWTGHACR